MAVGLQKKSPPSSLLAPIAFGTGDAAPVIAVVAAIAAIIVYIFYIYKARTKVELPAKVPEPVVLGASFESEIKSMKATVGDLEKKIARRRNSMKMPAG